MDALLTPPDRAAETGETTLGLPVELPALADGRYVLGRQLGAGGMGIVRAAHDELLDREVAVKLLADNLAADPEARERFLREARAAARINDPHVVAVHDVGDEAGRPYLVMELVDGPSLADELAAEGKLEPDTVVEVAAQALAGLARAHEAGLLHRDVKPGNLLRDPDGTIKVTDFGVAEAADTPGLTRTGFVIGTRSYLAPERRRGRPADARTDLYALGATLVELLTGRPPSDTDPVELPPHVPGGLRRLVDRLLATDADERPADAEAALEVLVGSGTSTGEQAVEAIDDDAGVVTAELGAGTRRLLSGRSGYATPWRAVAIIAIAVLATVLVVQFALTRDGSSPSVAPPAGDAQTDATDDVTGGTAGDGGVEPVQRVADDPEATARNLGAWLREQSRIGG